MGFQDLLFMLYSESSTFFVIVNYTQHNVPTSKSIPSFYLNQSIKNNQSIIKSALGDIFDILKIIPGSKLNIGS